MKQVYVGILLVLLAACGGTPPGTPTDITRPTLESSIPETGATDIAINTKLALAFSETMNEASLELTSSPAISLGTATWKADKTEVAFANGALTASTSYILTVKAKDVAGNALTATTIRFTTSDAVDTTSPTTPTGFVATAADGQVTLTWKANPETDLAGYTAYVGTEKDALEPSGFVTEPKIVIKELTNGTTYFFAVDAVDAANNRSSPTAPISATPTADGDTTPPTLVSSDPEDGATDINPRHLSIKLVFSEPIDTTTFGLTFAPPNPFPSIVNAIEPAATTPFEVTWSEGDTVATLALEPPNELLLENTTFTLTLSAEDKADNALSGDKEIAFTTGEEAPRLVSSTPENGATDVSQDRDAVITLAFSKPLDAPTFSYQADFSCNPGSFEESNTKLVLIECRLWDNHTYTVTFSGQGKTGKAFAGSMSFATVADAGSPRVTDTTPLNSATMIPLNTSIFIYFDDEMDEASTVAAVSSSLPLGCTWTLADANLLTCDPANLQADTTYIITVGTDAKDTSGHPFSNHLCRGSFPCPYSFKFSTGSTIDETEPRVDTDLSEPDNGDTDVALNSTINVIFSERMNEASVEQAFSASVNGGQVAGTFGWFKSGMVFFPTSPLPVCSDVSVAIGTSATDRALNPLANSYGITFKTICN